MAILLDERTGRAVAQRRIAGHDAAIRVFVAASRCLPEMLQARWGAPRGENGALQQHPMDGAMLYLGPRVARYVAKHDLTISIWGRGPAAHLIVADETRLMLELEEWEHAVGLFGTRS